MIADHYSARVAYKRAKREEAMTPTVAAACFLVWFGRAAGNKLEMDAARRCIDS